MRLCPLICHLLAALMALLPCAAAATDYEPVERIVAAAVAAVAPDAAANPAVRAEAAVDPGLRMPACSDGLSAHVGHRGVAEVSCIGPMAWKLFVPVKVSRMGDTLVLARPLASGQTVTPELVRVETRDQAGLAAGALERADQAVGRVAARALAAGSPLMATDLRAPRLVRRGDQVTLIARRGGLEVRSLGRALGDAGQDEQVNVENSSSRRQVRGVVNARGEVEILM
jgi:flagella basal body P-ring formation protein FlgA